jgi:plastocyanin
MTGRKRLAVIGIGMLVSLSLPVELSPIGPAAATIDYDQKVGDCTPVSVAQGSLDIKDDFFDPNPATFLTGGLPIVITWTNRSPNFQEHTTTAVNGDWRSPHLQPGDTWKVLFCNNGSWTYFCEVHGFLNMHATLTITN